CKFQQQLRMVMSLELVGVAGAVVSVLANLSTILDFFGVKVGNKDFEDKILDTHNELKKIHNNYSQLFTGVLVQIERGDSLDVVFNDFRSSRVANLGDRKALISKIETLIDRKENARYKDFFMAIREYFYGFNIRGGNNTPSNMLSHELNKWLDYSHKPHLRHLNEKLARETLIEVITNYINQLELGWENLDAKFNALKYT
ncbi:TPA: hypothetical protein ACGUS8_004679, partial [Vibrio vulnificus]